MKVRCLFFASSREAVGQSGVDFDVLEGTTSEEFKLNYLFPRYPNLVAIFQSCLLAVDCEYVDPENPVVLREGSEVAVIPPVSGG